MGLDVYKLKPVIVASTKGEIIDTESLSGFKVIAFEYFCEIYGGTNKRLLDLFKRFKDYVQTIQYECIDVDYYAKKYNVDMVEIDYKFKSELNDDLLPLYKNIGEDDTVKMVLDLDGNILYHSAKKLKIINTTDSALIFKEIGYNRSGDLPLLYDKFCGDVWYKKTDTDLPMVDARYWVYPEELDELKSCFRSDAVIQDWILSSDHIIYLNP